MLMNTETHRVYSDKLRLNVLELRESDLATDEDRKWRLDKWAKFFKAGTWEEIQMVAQGIPALEEAAETVYHISQNNRIREQCEAREDFFRRQRTTQRLMEQQKETIEQQRNAIENMNAELSENRRVLMDKDEELVATRGELAAKEEQLAAKEEQLAEQQQMLEESEIGRKRLEAFLKSKGINLDEVEYWNGSYRNARFE